MKANKFHSFNDGLLSAGHCFRSCGYNSQQIGKVLALMKFTF